MSPRFVLIACALSAIVAGTAAPAAAQSARVRYERALAQEKTLRSGNATPAALRAAAKTFEGITRRYPVSGYADNSLWQAAGLFKLAFDKSGQAADRQEAERLLTWLRREYPASSLVKPAAALLGEIAPAPAPPPTSPPQPVTAAATSTPPAAATPPPADPADPAPTVAVVRSVTHQQLPRGDRIIIELDREAAYSGDRVAGPDRVFFDFVNTAPATGVVQRADALAGAFVKTVRIGRPAGTGTRVVLELAGTPPPRFSAFPLYNPFRLVIDVESTAAAPATVAAPGPPPLPPAPVKATKTVVSPPPPTPTVDATSSAANRPAPPAATSRGDYSLARQLGLSVSRVVIDPGHGGHDPGAIAHGINESELVLDVSRRVAALLSAKPGFEVRLTRSTDEFIPLEERTAIANREPADLFLSIHANASRNPAARGIETYILNFATNPEAEAVAARENATSAQTMGALPSILKAIALNNKRDESRELATILQTGLIRRLKTPTNGVRDLGVKQAPFVVLIGAQMPSVLAEISFITNKADASLLKQASYRQQIAQAICDAIVKYQASLKKSTD